MATYIFDLDGTLSNNLHRLPLLKAGKWEEYNRACHLDTPIDPTIAMLRLVKSAGHSVFIWSGRSNTERAATVKWLLTHTGYEFTENDLWMRDNRLNNAELKLSWLKDLDGKLLQGLKKGAIFDDQPDTVAMFRNQGFVCYDVGSVDQSLSTNPLS